MPDSLRIPVVSSADSEANRVAGCADDPHDGRYPAENPKVLAFVEGADCVGCTLCIAACPADAIVGSAKQPHTVVAAWCIGCALCLPPCPVDCIRLLDRPDPGEPVLWDGAKQDLVAEAIVRARQLVGR